MTPRYLSQRSNMGFIATLGNIIPTLHDTGFSLIVSNSSFCQRGRASNLNGVDKALRKRARRAHRSLLREFREIRYFPRPRGNAAGCNYDHQRSELGRELRRYVEYNFIVVIFLLYNFKTIKKYYVRSENI